ncbi:MAG: hypothetical protein J5944_11300 [Lentisphaeria bacterium]|nr:hypothetical protein [Lentisphaeria bacterium]
MLLIVGRTSSSGTFHRNAAKEYNADRDAYSSRYQQSFIFHFIIFTSIRTGVLSHWALNVSRLIFSLSSFRQSYHAHG